MKNNIFISILTIFIVFFVLLLFAQSQGYYQNKNEKAKTLTEKQIEEYEKDIEEGKQIDLKKYMIYEDKDYTNTLTKGVYKVSLKLEKVMDSVVRLVFNKTGSLVSD